MVIDLNSNISNNLSTRRSSEKEAVSNDSAPTSGQTENVSSEVSISTEAQSMNRLAAAIDQTSDFNAERVESLRAAIADGSYEINAERIANGILNSDELGE